MEYLRNCLLVMSTVGILVINCHADQNDHSGETKRLILQTLADLKEHQTVGDLPDVIFRVPLLMTTDAGPGPMFIRIRKITSTDIGIVFEVNFIDETNPAAMISLGEESLVHISNILTLDLVGHNGTCVSALTEENP